MLSTALLSRVNEFLWEVKQIRERIEMMDNEFEFFWDNPHYLFGHVMSELRVHHMILLSRSTPEATPPIPAAAPISIGEKAGAMTLAACKRALPTRQLPAYMCIEPFAKCRGDDTHAAGLSVTSL